MRLHASQELSTTRMMHGGTFSVRHASLPAHFRQSCAQAFSIRDDSIRSKPICTHSVVTVLRLQPRLTNGSASHPPVIELAHCKQETTAAGVHWPGCGATDFKCIVIATLAKLCQSHGWFLQVGVRMGIEILSLRCTQWHCNSGLLLGAASGRGTCASCWLIGAKLPREWPPAEGAGRSPSRPPATAEWLRALVGASRGGGPCPGSGGSPLGAPGVASTLTWCEPAARRSTVCCSRAPSTCAQEDT